jgi:myosin heavy subunit
MPLIALLFSRPSGFLRLLDEESVQMRMSDSAMLQKVSALNTPAYPPVFTIFKGHMFTLVHYAGRVQYDAQGFLDSSRERMPHTVPILLRGSRIELVREMYSSRRSVVGIFESADITNSKDDDLPVQVERPPEKKDKKDMGNLKKDGKAISDALPDRRLGRRFLLSWKKLLTTFKLSKPHFVLCVKPNTEVCRFSDILCDFLFCVFTKLTIARIIRDFPKKRCQSS